MGEIHYSYERIEGKEIVIRELKGEISAIEIINSFNYLIEHQITRDCVGILTDTTEAEFKFSIRQFSKILHYLKRTKELVPIKIAVLVKTPEKTIFPFIAAKQIKSLKIRPFSTKENAYQWMLS